MLVIVGIVILLGCVFGSFVADGGAMGPVIEATPFELLSIGGAALGSLVISGSVHDLKHTFGGIMKAIKGPRFKKQSYIELLVLMFQLMRLASSKGLIAIEAHIENPEESTLFKAFPSILKDHHATAMISDYLRMVGMNADDPHQIEDVMARELKKARAEELHPSHSLQTMSDGLPALGIVAAVLGVIKTMGHIDQSPVILGHMIGGAMTGTFLGVLMSYGMVGPLATRLAGVVDEESKYYQIIRAVIVSHLHGNAPQVSIESGRKEVPTHLMPSFSELETAVQAAPVP